MSFNAVNKVCASFLQSIAIISEQLNEFAIKLTNIQKFPSVTTGTEMRLFNSGWKFQKWVEASINNEDGLAAVWWFDLFEDGKHWQINTSISITHGDYYEELPTLYTDNVEDGIQLMKKAVGDLIMTYDSIEEFRNEIDKNIEK